MIEPWPIPEGHRTVGPHSRELRDPGSSLLLKRGWRIAGDQLR
ncbi:hypothetical protein ATKI12_2589 [Kitasatospora sp. Ki12]